MRIYAICFTLCFTLISLYILPIEKLQLAQSITHDALVVTKP